MSPEERAWRHSAEDLRAAARASDPRMPWARDHAAKAVFCDLQADIIAIEGLDPDPFALRPGDAALLRGETLPGAAPDEARP